MTETTIQTNHFIKYVNTVFVGSSSLYHIEFTFSSSILSYLISIYLNTFIASISLVVRNSFSYLYDTFIIIEYSICGPFTTTYYIHCLYYVQWTLYFPCHAVQFFSHFCQEIHTVFSIYYLFFFLSLQCFFSACLVLPLPRIIIWYSTILAD